ncbi:MAG: hypothetical protein Sylvanvirus10_16 [Sylvanvirus sp.]|uniref:Uncharacterized protein n=1 Tax=Sylvanvirus sp. TaxID=2487774 RepID=A0A3G5ALG7_9VIRU|nr:MAG: hypothetical protein Sylvanvirus10_16 [Sylvanvirus sp.]
MDAQQYFTKWIPIDGSITVDEISKRSEKLRSILRNHSLYFDQSFTYDNTLNQTELDRFIRLLHIQVRNKYKSEFIWETYHDQKRVSVRLWCVEKHINSCFFGCRTDISYRCHYHEYSGDMVQFNIDFAELDQKTQNLLKNL